MGLDRTVGCCHKFSTFRTGHPVTPVANQRFGFLDGLDFAVDFTRERRLSCFRAPRSFLAFRSSAISCARADAERTGDGRRGVVGVDEAAATGAADFPLDWPDFETVGTKGGAGGNSMRGISAQSSSSVSGTSIGSNWAS